MRKWGERRSFVRPPVEKHFESRRKAMIHMKLKATKFESQFLSGMLEGLYGTVKVGNTIQCQSDWLYRVKPNRSCEFLDENFLLLDNNSNARQQIETKLDSEVLDNFDQFIIKRSGSKRKFRSGSAKADRANEIILTIIHDYLQFVNTRQQKQEQNGVE